MYNGHPTVCNNQPNLSVGKHRRNTGIETTRGRHCVAGQPNVKTKNFIKKFIESA